MSRLVEVFCATQRHQKTKNKKTKKTKRRQRFQNIILYLIIPLLPRHPFSALLLVLSSPNHENIYICTSTTTGKEEMKAYVRASDNPDSCTRDTIGVHSCCENYGVDKEYAYMTIDVYDVYIMMVWVSH